MRTIPLLLFFFLLFSLNSLAQEEKDSLSIPIEEYVNINNTRIYFPPSTFETEPNLMGMLKGEQALIQVMETTEDSFKNQVQNFKPEIFEERGGVILTQKDTLINGHTAKYIIVESPPRQKTMLLLFGNDDFCVMLAGVNSNRQDEETNSEIEYLLKNIQYHEGEILDPLANAAFYVKENDSGFQHAKYFSNIHLYTLNGEFDQDADNFPLITITTGALNSETEFDKLAIYAIQSLESNGILIENEIHQEKSEFNGYSAYENKLEVKIEGEPRTLYLLLLYDQQTFVQLQGITDDQEDLAIIKTFTQQLRLKTN